MEMIFVGSKNYVNFNGCVSSFNEFRVILILVYYSNYIECKTYSSFQPSCEVVSQHLSVLVLYLSFFRDAADSLNVPRRYNSWVVPFIFLRLFTCLHFLSRLRTVFTPLKKCDVPRVTHGYKWNECFWNMFTIYDFWGNLFGACLPPSNRFFILTASK